MKYALVNEERTDAQPELKGNCPACGQPTIAKCGELKIWHWAHKGIRVCDKWWENETNWHRSWKNCFPSELQEVIHQDSSGERHIADVKTAEGCILEFQHSYLKPEERIIRTDFYKNIAWIVDGTRRLRDSKNFFEVFERACTVYSNPKVKVCPIFDFECALFKDWMYTEAAVFFDFGEENLYLLLPKDIDDWRYFVEFPRGLFISLHNKDKSGTDNTFDDCYSKLCIFASEHRKNQLYRWHHLLDVDPHFMKLTNQQKALRERADNHLKKLKKRMSEVMAPFFNTSLDD